MEFTAEERVPAWRAEDGDGRRSAAVMPAAPAKVLLSICDGLFSRVSDKTVP